jgi:DNA-binding beta-propeller fold protein YncE
MKLLSYRTFALVLILTGTALCAQAQAPGPIAFDGTHIWVGDQITPTSGRLVELDPATGAQLATFALPGPPTDIIYPYGASDLWITTIGPQPEVLEWLLSSNTQGRVFRTLTNPRAVVVQSPSDLLDCMACPQDSYLWVAEQGGAIEKFDLASNTRVAEYTGFNNASSMVYTGINIWVGYRSSSGVGQISKINFNGDVLLTLNANWPLNMTLDGTGLWVMSLCECNVVKYDGSGNLLFTVNAGFMPVSAVSDGTNLWVVDFKSAGPGQVTKVVESNGQVLGTFNVGNKPLMAAFDGTNVWVTNYADGTVTKLLASNGANEGTFSAQNYSVPRGHAGGMELARARSGAEMLTLRENALKVTHAAIRGR